MNEEENLGVEPQDQAQVIAQDHEAETIQPERHESQEADRKRNETAYNFSEMRRKEKEMKTLIQEQRELIESLKKQQIKPEDDDFGIKDDDLAEGKHLKELKKEIRQLKQELEKSKAVTLEDRLQIKYPDYNEVLTPENIEQLKQLEPELAMSISHMPDPYSQAVAAYKLLKKVGISKQEQSIPVEKKKAIENSQKPVSVQAVTKQSAIGNAHLFENGLSKDLKKQLWEEMQAAMKG